MNDADTHYPDSPPDTLGTLKDIKRLPLMKKAAPRIQWGDEYMSWPLPKRLDYAERLAASMNNAADVLQKERDELLAIVTRQESQLKHAAHQYLGQGEVMHRELGNADAEKQELYVKIVRLKKTTKEQGKIIKQQAARIKELEEQTE